MFIAALCTISRTWKQPRCPSTDEWIKKMWYTMKNRILLSKKKGKFGSFAVMWVDLVSVIQSEVRKTNTYINAYTRNLENWYR